MVMYLGGLLLRLFSMSLVIISSCMAAGGLQTCVHHDANSEAAIHAYMKSIFDDEDTRAALLVDATIYEWFKSSRSFLLVCPSIHPAAALRQTNSFTVCI